MNNRGSVAIEMAFILPAFLLLLLATIELNRYFWTGYWLDYNLQQAVRDEALTPGIGVEARVLKGIGDILIDKSNLKFSISNVQLAKLSLTQFNISYHSKFYFYPNQNFYFYSNNWLADNENSIL